MTRYTSGKNAPGICDICGWKYKLHQLEYQVVNRVRTGVRACPTCISEDHPQLQVGRLRVVDPQAVKDPRPDVRDDG